MENNCHKSVFTLNLSIRWLYSYLNKILVNNILSSTYDKTAVNIFRKRSYFSKLLNNYFSQYY